MNVTLALVATLFFTRDEILTVRFSEETYLSLLASNSMAQRY